MSQDFFFGPDGTPLGGKIPIELRLNGLVTPSASAAATRLANQYLTEVRLGGLDQMRRQITLADGTSVEFAHFFGTTVLTVTAPPNPKREKEPFYGGILIHPSYYASLTDVFGPDEPNLNAPRFVADSVTRAGKEPGKPGRPAVPGTANDVATDWLVMQVDPKKPLASEPVRTGAVRFFRIADPQFGPVVECNKTPETYLLSAKQNFSEFYLCGKKIATLPPLPLTLPETAWTLSRIRTFNFVPESFMKAERTRGVVIVAVDKKLFAINTRTESPAWSLLATATFDYALTRANDFGSDFMSETLPSGGRRISCYGSNGAGACSSFTVDITPVPGGGLALSGTITLAHDGTIEATPNRVTFTTSMRYDIYTRNTTCLFRVPDGETYDIIEWPIGVKHGESFFSYSGALSGAAMPLVQDRFFGGALPRYSAGGYTRNVTITKRVDEAGFGHNPALDAGSWIESPNFELTYNFSDVRSATGETSDTRVVTTTYSQQVSLSAATVTSMPRTEAYSHVETTITDLPPDPVLQRSLVYADTPGSSTLAWKRSAARTGTLVTYAPISLPARLNEFHVEITDGPYNTLPVTQEVRTYSPLSLSFALVRSDGTELVSWPDALTRFVTSPSWADTRSVTTTRDPGPYPHTGGQYALYGVSQVLHSIGTGTPLNSDSFVETWDGWFTGPSLDLYGYAHYPSDLPMPTHTVPAPGGTTTEFHDALTVTHESPSAMSPYVLDTLQLSNPYADRVSMTIPDPPLPAVVSISTGAGVNFSAAPDTSGVAPPLMNELSAFDSIKYDPRSGGFLAESFWYTEHISGLWRSSLVSFVGNKHGAVDFRPVLDEWVALGAEDFTIKLRPVFAGHRSDAGFSVMGLI